MTKKQQQSVSKAKAKPKPKPEPAPPLPRKDPEVTDTKAAFKDARGEIANILDAAIGHIAVIRSVAGAVRGNHYHKEDDQWIYVVSGRMATRAVDPVTEEKWSYYVEEGQLEYMPPGIAHAYWFPKETVFLNLTPRPRDMEIKDQTIPWEVWNGPPRPSM